MRLCALILFVILTLSLIKPDGNKLQPSLLTHIFISNEFAFGFEWSIQNSRALDAKYFYLLLSFDWFEVPTARK